MRQCVSFTLIFMLFLLVPALASSQDKGDQKAGKAKYEQLCVGCHGATGKGDGPAAAALNPKPRDYTHCKEMAKESDANLFKAIKGGGPSIGRSPLMPQWGGVLKDVEIQNLVAYIRSFCKK